MKLKRERDRTKISNVVKKKKFLMNLPNNYPLKDVVKFFLIIVLTGMSYRKLKEKYSVSLSIISKIVQFITSKCNDFIEEYLDLGNAKDRVTLARQHSINPRLNIFSLKVDCIDIRYRPQVLFPVYHSYKLNAQGIKFLVALLPNGMWGYSSSSELLSKKNM